jgi:hydrogenase nickel incorporation protein HypB
MHERSDEHTIERLLEDNEQLAAHNREHFDQLGCFVINLMSAPGAGKTSLIAATAPLLGNDFNLAVIEGDMVGELDSDRLKAVGINAFQISTGKNCHLDSTMVARLLHSGEVGERNFVFIENVGNLVCPAEFPLGEHKRVVLLSVTEGDDKPLKYPVIFRNCDAVIMTKCELLPHVDFDPEKMRRAVRGLNAAAQIFELSARTGEGMAQWIEWIKEQNRQYKKDLLAGSLHEGVVSGARS